ncbi:MAG: nickel-dependent lactate racemase [Pseudomonadota bacterium]
MDIELEYGRSGLTLPVPDGVRPTVIRKPRMVLPDDPATEIARVLDSPMDVPALTEFASGARTACILICDITRPVPNHLFLRPIIERLLAAGLDASAITVLIATGLHRPNLGAELAELVGDAWVTDTVRVVNHDARDSDAHVDLGRTGKHDCPVKLDRLFVDAEIKIATGLVEPHFMAGYSGGRKVIAPGIAFHETIRTFHSARFMEHPAATSCNLAGNPLHETQIEIVDMLNSGSDRSILSLNTVLDDQRNLAFVSFGEILASHMAAVDFARDSCEVSVGRRFKTVVTTSAGYPLDKTYYQTVKGMVTPLDILAPGGTLIIASECSEGVGSPEFRASQERLVALGPDAFLASLTAKNIAEIDEWQTEMQLKPMRVGDVVLYAPGLGETGHAVTGVSRTDDLAQAVRSAVDRQGDAEIAVIPEGPYVVPFAKTALAAE